MHVAQDRDRALQPLLIPADIPGGHPDLAELPDGKALRVQRGVQLGDGEHHVLVAHAHGDFLADKQLLQRHEQRPVWHGDGLGGSRAHRLQTG